MFSHEALYRRVLGVVLRAHTDADAQTYVNGELIGDGVVLHHVSAAPVSLYGGV